jgi:WG containing repeat
LARIGSLGVIANLRKIAALGAVVLLSLKPSYARDEGGAELYTLLDCWQPDRTVRQCAAAGPDGLPRLRQSYLRHLRYDSRALAAVYVLGPGDARTGQWFYVRRNAGMAPVMKYDNGPDDFSDGLARSPVGHKIGYIDRRLRFVIPARYDGAYPFAGGVAVVCLGCASVSDGGHSWYEGGEWRCVDRHGQELTVGTPTKDQPFDALCRRAR